MTTVALDYSVTPRLSAHARMRCAQMGVSTKRAKRVFRLGDVDYPGPTRHGDNRVRYGDADPHIAIAYRVDDWGVPVILTVLWRRDLGAWTRDDPPPGLETA